MQPTVACKIQRQLRRHSCAWCNSLAANDNRAPYRVCTWSWQGTNPVLEQWLWCGLVARTRGDSGKLLTSRDVLRLCFPEECPWTKSPSPDRASRPCLPGAGSRSSSFCPFGLDWTWRSDILSQACLRRRPSQIPLCNRAWCLCAASPGVARPTSASLRALQHRVRSYTDALQRESYALRAFCSAFAFSLANWTRWRQMPSRMEAVLLWRNVFRPGNQTDCG